MRNPLNVNEPAVANEIEVGVQTPKGLENFIIWGNTDKLTLLSPDSDEPLPYNRSKKYGR